MFMNFIQPQFYRLNLQLAFIYHIMASSQYSVLKHTIIPLIFKITHQTSFSYLIKDPQTSSLILLPSSEEPQELKKHIINIQNEFRCNLTHSITNSLDNSHYSKLFDQKVITPETQGELKPELIGQLSLCFIKAAGYYPNYHLIAATHITPTSTKFPVLFVGNMLSICSVDHSSTAKSKNYLETINKIKIFPNQTLIFPSKMANLDDLQFALALDKNDILHSKAQLLKQKHKQMKDCLIPTSILQEKKFNPFFNPSKYSNLLKSQDKTVCFDLLRKMRQQWKVK